MESNDVIQTPSFIKKQCDIHILFKNHLHDGSFHLPGWPVHAGHGPGGGHRAGPGHLPKPGGPAHHHRLPRRDGETQGSPCQGQLSCYLCYRLLDTQES